MTDQAMITSALRRVWDPNVPTQEVGLRFLINYCLKGDARELFLRNPNWVELVRRKFLDPSNESEVVKMLCMWTLAHLALSQDLCPLLASEALIDACRDVLLDADNTDIMEKTLWFLCNVSFGNNVVEILSAADLVPVLVDLFNHEILQIKLCAMRAVFPLINPRTNPFAAQNQIVLCKRKGFIPVLNVLKEPNGNQDLVIAALNITQVLSQSGPETETIMRKILFSAGAVDIIAQLLHSDNNATFEPAFFIAYNLSKLAGNEKLFLDADFVTIISDMFGAATASERIRGIGALLLFNLITHPEFNGRKLYFTGFGANLIPTLKGSDIASAMYVVQLIRHMAIDDIFRLEFTSCKALAAVEELEVRVRAMQGDDKAVKYLDIIQTTKMELAKPVSVEKKREILKIFSPKSHSSTSPEKKKHQKKHRSSLKAPISPQGEDGSSKKAIPMMPRSQTQPLAEKRSPSGWQFAKKASTTALSPMLGRKEGETPMSEGEVEPEMIDPAHQKRTNIAMEILETERSYVKGLEKCIRFYFKNERGPQILGQAAWTALFGNIEEVLKVNETFYDDLDERMKKWGKRSNIGDLFAKFWTSGMEPVYSKYINQFDDSINKYYELMETNQHFKEFINSVKKEAGLDLGSFLIMPIQRLPRYTLLLNSLVKCTPVMHADCAQLAHASKVSVEVTQRLNEAKRDAENVKKVEELSKKIIGYPETLVDGRRRFVRQGLVTEVNKSKGSQYRFVILLSDVIIITVQHKGNYKFLKKENVRHMSVESIEDNRNDNIENGIKFVYSHGHDIMCMSSASERDEWRQAINDTKRRLMECK